MTVKSRRKLNFKHSGTNIAERQFSEPVNVPSVPIGIKTPLRLNTSGLSNLFEMNFQPADQIHDNLINLIKTNHGERLGRTNYGANLKSLSFDLAYVGDFEQAAIENIRLATERSMPIVEISNVGVSTSNHEKDGPLPPGVAKVLITVTYNVPRLKIIEKKLQAVIYAGG